MGHGKETPRQKMIGMMYLVLTALLALNVSKEVLNAFVIVDEGISNMNKNYVEKNSTIYSEFDKALVEKPQKTKKWYGIAKEIKDKANSLDAMIQDLKIAIINKADKAGNPAVKGREIMPMQISSEDDANIPGQIMIVEGQGAKLKGAIDDFRKYILDNIDPRAENVRSAIEKSLSTKPPPMNEVGKTETWESEHFEHLPLVGVTTILTGLQSNIRNSESDMLRYLFSLIDKGTFKFTSLEGIVMQNSNYVIQGTDYNARVFLAAFDTSQNPTIYVGPYDSVKTEEGYDYQIKKDFKYDTLKVQKGKGVYTRKGGGVGFQKWGGLIKLKAPEGGTDIYKPFKAEYQVAEASLVVSPTKMNVFYLGVDNPVEVSVPGISPDKLTVNISNGSIKPVGKSSYIVNPARAGQAAQVTVSAKIDNQMRSMGTKDFRVRIVPDPVAKVNGIKGTGTIDKNVFLAQVGVVAEMENFEFDLSFKVTEFNVSTTIGGFATDKFVKSNRFSDEQKALIKQASKNQKVYIEGIKAVGPDGTTRQLGTIALTIK